MKDTARFDTHLRRALFTEYLREAWLGIALFILILSLAAGMLSVQLRQKQSALDDLRGASPQTGTATVTGITSRPVSRRHPEPEMTIYLTIGDRQTWVTSRHAVQIGESFQATYRVGRSGTVYVDKMRQLPEKPSAVSP
jgi:hypothetical protein